MFCGILHSVASRASVCNINQNITLLGLDLLSSSGEGFALSWVRWKELIPVIGSVDPTDLYPSLEGGSRSSSAFLYRISVGGRVGRSPEN
jgi:hypothetical protein